MRLLNLIPIKKNELFLIGAIFLYMAIFSFLSYKRYWAGFANEWEDIAWINNLYWNMLQGDWNYFYQNYIQGTLVDFHPSIAVLIFPIFYAILPNIYFVIMTPTIFISLAAWPLYKIAKLIWKDDISATVVAVAYLFYAPKHSIAFVEDQTLFIIPLLAFSFYAAIQGKFKLFFIFNFLIATAKTESAIYSVLITTYFLWHYRKHEKRNLLIGQFVLLSIWSIFYLYFDLSANATNYMQAGERVFNIKNIYEIVYILLPLLLLPLRSSFMLLVIPCVILLITKRHFLPQQAYYLAPAIIFAFVSLILTLGKILNTHKEYFRYILLACLFACILSNFMPNLIGNYLPVTDQSYKNISNISFIGKNNVFDSQFYRIDPKMKTLNQIIPQINQNDSVSATGDLLPYIPARKKIYEVFDPINDYTKSEYILITKTYQGFGAGNYYWSESGSEIFIEELKKSTEYKILMDENNVIVFKRM